VLEPGPDDGERLPPAWRAYPVRFTAAIVLTTPLFRLLKGSWSEGLGASVAVGLGWLTNLAWQRRVARKPAVWRAAYKDILRYRVPSGYAEVTEALAILTRRRAIFRLMGLILFGVGLIAGVVGVVWVGPSGDPPPALAGALLFAGPALLAALSGFVWLRSGRLLRKCRRAAVLTALATALTNAVRRGGTTDALDAAGWSA
jgi:hypothetical protein